MKLAFSRQFVISLVALQPFSAYRNLFRQVFKIDT